MVEISIDVEVISRLYGYAQFRYVYSLCIVVFCCTVLQANLTISTRALIELIDLISIKEIMQLPACQCTYIFMG